MATSKYNFVLSLPAAVLMTLGVASVATAGTKTITEETIIMKPGNKAGLQYLYAWDKNCRAVPVRFKALKSPKGRLYTVPGRFKVASSQSAECAGKSIPGKKVVFKADRNASGATVVQYRISSKNTFDDFIISRPITVRN